jgi:VIT1/CCC1 family predicted Fe2+/Mn2+ transporter/rubrerythrin
MSATPTSSVRTPAAASRKLLAVLEKNWQAEKSGQYTYEALAKRVRDPVRKEKLLEIARAEQHHAELWAERIRELGGTQPEYAGSATGEADSLANRIGGPDVALRRLELDESRDIAKYGRQLKQLGDEGSLEILRRVIEDEREHYRTLRDLIRTGGSRPHRVRELKPLEARQLLDELIAKREQGQPRAAGWIGDAIYGINDGLGAIFGIVSGVSGATLGNSKFVLLAGLAGMIASALSMGSGAYLAAKSEREIYEAELSREREAVSMNESEARELVSLYYQVKGLPSPDADKFVDHLIKDKEQFVRTLAAERLNATEEGLRNPTVSALSGALSTAVGASIPVIPFFFMSGYPAVITAAVVSLVAHFAVGAAKSLITVRSWWSSGMEMTLVGAVEGVVTYVIGIGLGHIA